MRTTRNALTGLCVTILMFAGSAANGQTAESPASLFERGSTFLEDGDVTAACPLLQESYDREPKDGRLVALAKCRDGQGKSATALELYRAYLRAIAAMNEESRQNHAEREQIALERVEQIEMRVPKLKLVWRGNVPKGVKVTVDESDALIHLNTEWPLDPGEHHVVVERWKGMDEPHTVTLQYRVTTEVDLTPPAPTPTFHLVSTAKSSAPLTKMPPKNSGSPNVNLSTIGLFVSGGFIAVAIGTGIGAGIMGLQSEDNWIENNCTRGTVNCLSDFSDAQGTMVALGNTAWVTGMIGGIIGTTSLIGMFRARQKAPAAAFGITPTGAFVRLKF